jgi:FkbM family methyltransferase
MIYKINQRLKSLLYKQLALEWKLRSGLNVQVKSQAEWVIYNDIFVDGEYDVPIQRIIESKLDEKPLHVLDLGANVGFFSLRLADKIISNQRLSISYEVTLVEGSPRVYEQLKYRFEKEISLAGKTNIIFGLVGERQGYGKISESDFHVMNSIIANSSKNGVYVPYVDLDKVYPEGAEIDLIKCDIEGSELVFLKNYQDLLLRTKAAIFEFHYDKCDVSQCFKILESIGLINHCRLRHTPTISLDFFWR